MKAGTIRPTPEPPVPKVPIDYKWAAELGLVSARETVNLLVVIVIMNAFSSQVRKPANFVSSVSDERGEELLYAGDKIIINGQIVVISAV